MPTFNHFGITNLYFSKEKTKSVQFFLRLQLRCFYGRPFLVARAFTLKRTAHATISFLCSLIYREPDYDKNVNFWKKNMFLVWFAYLKNSSVCNKSEIIDSLKFLQTLKRTNTPQKCSVLKAFRSLTKTFCFVLKTFRLM